MRFFSSSDVLLSGETAQAIYSRVKELPIIDYHCHLDPKMIAENAAFEDIGAFWLATDHYKWRAMRMCGVDEYYITGDASYHEKFLKYAEIVPQLCGNPLYYWTHMELRKIFDIRLPLSAESAETVYEKANEMINIDKEDTLTRYQE
jgi:glucuronate isomerase